MIICTRLEKDCEWTAWLKMDGSDEEFEQVWGSSEAEVIGQLFLKHPECFGGVKIE